MFEPVRNYKDILENTKVFHKSLGSSEELTKRLGYFRHWYYLEEFDTFAPGRFIEYRDIKLELYVSGSSKWMEGGEAAPHLKYWFCLIDNADKELYIKKLEALLNLYDKKPNRILYLYHKKVEEYEQLSF